MSSRLGRLRLSSVIPAACFMLAAAGTSVMADEPADGSFCTAGMVAEFDYSEMSERLREGVWTTRGGVVLYTAGEQAKLAVVDVDGNSVCEEGENIARRCTFRLSMGDRFNIQVDNRDSSREASYRVCSFNAVVKTEE